MVAEQAHDLPDGELIGVNLALRRRWSEDAIPQEREQRTFAATAQAVRAFAAHSGVRCGIAYVVRACERIEELQLALGGPPVVADSSGFGWRPGIGCAHPPAWIICAAL